MSQLTCRFYLNTLPIPGDVLMVRGVSKPEDNSGVYVELLEYDGLQGFISTREFKVRKWEGHMASYCTALLGRLLCAEVTDVIDGYVDLSLKLVTSDDAAGCRERYSKGKLVQTILRRVAHRLHLKSTVEFNELYQKSVWKLAATIGNVHCSTVPFDLFRKAALGDASVLDVCDTDREILLDEILKRLSKKPVDVTSHFEVTCFRQEGIDSIKQALIAGLDCSTNEIQLKINLVSSPEYIVRTKSLDELQAVKTVENALTTIETTILKLGGSFKLVSKAEVFYSDVFKNEDEEDGRFNDDSGIVADFV